MLFTSYFLVFVFFYTKCSTVNIDDAIEDGKEDEKEELFFVPKYTEEDLLYLKAFQKYLQGLSNTDFRGILSGDLENSQTAKRIEIERLIGRALEERNSSEVIVGLFKKLKNLNDAVKFAEELNDDIKAYSEKTFIFAESSSSSGIKAKDIDNASVDSDNKYKEFASSCSSDLEVNAEENICQNTWSYETHIENFGDVITDSETITEQQMNVLNMDIAVSSFIALLILCFLYLKMINDF